MLRPRPPSAFCYYRAAQGQARTRLHQPRLPPTRDGDLALGWESGIGTTGQYPRQDLIPGNMDDGFHHRDDETVLGVRAISFSGWGKVRLLMIAAPDGGKGTQGE